MENAETLVQNLSDFFPIFTNDTRLSKVSVFSRNNSFILTGFPLEKRLSLNGWLLY